MYQLCFLYLSYSFLGWVAETVVATARGKVFVNRGLTSGPFCTIYGIAAIVLAVSMNELRTNLPFLFLGCTIVCTVIEWFAAKFLEAVHNRRWWDYSAHRWNIDGYICLEYSLLWGVLGSCTVLWGNSLLARLFGLLPGNLGKVLVWSGMAVALLDQLASLLAVEQIKRPSRGLQRFDKALQRRTAKLQSWIVASVERRIARAYPRLRQPDAAEAARIRAHRSRLDELVWLFVLGALIGDIVETIFCRVVGGVWMSRSSLVWGPFSVVWGAALVMAAVLLRNSADKSPLRIFLFGALMGGAYEYLCSVFTERLFGVVFWDYSHMRFNLGGRINLLYCVFWGFAALAWLRAIYPLLAKLIDAIRAKTGHGLTVALAIFMAVNILVSTAALARYQTRSMGLAPANRAEQLLDERFDDARMQRIYPNAQKR